MELNRNWKFGFKNCEILPTVILIFLVIVSIQGQPTNGTSGRPFNDVEKCSCNISLKVTDTEQQDVEDVCQTGARTQVFESRGHSGLLRCAENSSTVFLNCTHVSCLVISHEEWGESEGSGSGEGSITTTSHHKLNRRNYRCCWTPHLGSNPLLFPLLLCLSIALVILLLLVILIALWWRRSKSHSVTKDGNKSTALPVKNDVTVEVVPGGIDNPALDYTSMSEFHSRGPPSDRKDVASNGLEVALNDQEAYNNGIVPLKENEREEFNLESEDTKL